MTTNPHPSIVSPAGDTTHVLVPKAEYDRLAAAAPAKPNPDAIAEALAVLRDPQARWHDANDIMAQLLANGLAAERKARELSQTQLGELLGMAQSQVSRYEKSPDGLTVGILRQIAAALASVPKASPKVVAPRRAVPKRKAG